MQNTMTEIKNIIFHTQSNSYSVFEKMIPFLPKLERIGFFITDKHNSIKFYEANKNNYDIVSEWDILTELKDIDYSQDCLKKIEEKYGEPFLWNALLNDRRVRYKIKSQFVQSYENKYSHFDQQKLLFHSFRRIEKQIELIKPDVVVGLNAVTVYDYIYYLICRKLNIPYLQLKLTRFKNHVHWYSKPYGICNSIQHKYNLLSNIENFESSPIISEIEEFITSSRETKITYEGAFVGNTNFLRLAGVGRKLKNSFVNWKRKDPHNPSKTDHLYYGKVIKSFRKKRKLDFDINFGGENIPSKYVLMPLNTEPEVALMSYGRPFVNQIETVRQVAQNIPVSWKLVVKEHPAALGYRNKSYYEKLKEIPNVLIASSNSDTNLLISNAELVCVVFGTIGLEAIIKRKPLLTFSETPYGILPENMVMVTKKYWSLADDIKFLIDNYQYCEKSLLRYMLATLDQSVPVDLFTKMLQKSGRLSSSNDRKIEEQYADLARTLAIRVKFEQDLLHA